MKKAKLICLSIALLLVATLVFSACLVEGFEITSPTTDSVTDINPRVTWSAHEQAQSYLLQLSMAEDFSEIIAEEQTTKTFWSFSELLSYSTKYYARVQALADKNGKQVVLKTATTGFTTQADHDTPNYDGTKTRTIHDFEDFATSDEIYDTFQWHAGGDSLKPSLSENGGVDESQAMLLTYIPGDYGWSKVDSINDADKKVWSGAKGIRFWVDGGGCGATMSITLGKRGYQRWTARFVLRNQDPQYISIPFSAFEDIGGGDGIWDDTGIVHLAFGVKGGTKGESYQIVVDDITIGSDELHSFDTRYLIETKNKSDMLEDFESYINIADALSHWSYTGVDSSNFTLTSGNDQSLKVTFAESFSLTMADYDFAQYGSADANGLRIGLTTNLTESALVKVIISSNGNDYYATKQMYPSKNSVNMNGSMTYVAVDFAMLKPVDESNTQPFDKTQMDGVTIAVEGEFSKSYNFVIDNLDLYTTENGALDAITFDFTNSVWTVNSASTLTVSDDGVPTIANATSNVSQYQCKNDSNYLWSWKNFQHYYAIKLNVTTQNVKTISYRLLNQNNHGIKWTITPAEDGTHDVTLYMQDFVYHSASTDPVVEVEYLQFNFIFMYVTYNSSAGGSFTINNMEILMG